MTISTNNESKAQILSSSFASSVPSTLNKATDTGLPDGFNPDSYESIPYGSQTLFDESNPEVEKLARESIRLSLEKRLGCGVVSRDDLATRFGLKKLGYSQADLQSGKVKLR